MKERRSRPRPQGCRRGDETDDKEKIDAKAQVLSQLRRNSAKRCTPRRSRRKAHRTAATQKHRSRQMRLTSSTPQFTEVKDKKG